jgi:hypothetical protein
VILFGIPRSVQRFFAPLRHGLSRPIRRALPLLVLALLLAPHYRSLKTLAGGVLGDRVAVSTISRRLRNPRWRTRDWYTSLYDDFLDDTNRWERRHTTTPKGRKRSWVVIVDVTYHSTLSQRMENLIRLSRRRHPNARATNQHAFVMGVLLTETGARLPLPRRSYYTKEYCQQTGRRYHTTVQLAAQMVQELRLPEDVDLTVVFDSAFDARDVHRVCRDRSFRAVFPIDPNRTLSAGSDVAAAGLAGQKVVHWTKTWRREEFTLLELQYANEDHVFFRRRHRDNLRLPKTQRRYVVASRQATVTHLGNCVVVASYKENPSVELLPGQSADWWSVHTAPVTTRKRRRPQPQRWHGKVLACTEATATARQVIEWYEVRWQIELFFRELKSRLQFRRYVLQKFEAVERYLDLLLMGMLLLEKERLQRLRTAGPPAARGGEPWVQARTTDQLRSLEALCHEWNVEVLRQRLQTARGRRRLLRDLQQQTPCHVP